MKREPGNTVSVFCSKTKNPSQRIQLWDEHHNQITRGTTQIVPLVRNTTSDSSKSYSLTQNHGNAYWRIQHSGSEGIHSIAYHRLAPTVGSLWTLATLCVSSSQLIFWIISQKDSFVKPFPKNFSSRPKCRKLLLKSHAAASGGALIYYKIPFYFPDIIDAVICRRSY